MHSVYKGSTIEVAKNLLGMELVHASPEGVTIGRIVETEAYLKDDPACHASQGKTKRNAMMFAKAGTAYLYTIYGIYACFNIVTAQKGVGEAVLIRALEPVSGIRLMQKRRGKNDRKALCSGPSKLVIAMGMEKVKHNGLLIQNGSALRLRKGTKDFSIVETTRIGISQGAALPYRFYIKGNPYISRK